MNHRVAAAAKYKNFDKTAADSAENAYNFTRGLLLAGMLGAAGMGSLGGWMSSKMTSPTDSDMKNMQLAYLSGDLDTRISDMALLLKNERETAPPAPTSVKTLKSMRLV